MNARTWIGVVLVVIGLAGLIYGGITYQSRSNVLEMGSLRVQVDETQQIPLSPVVGTVALVVGVVLIIRGRPRSSSGA